MDDPALAGPTRPCSGSSTGDDPAVASRWFQSVLALEVAGRPKIDRRLRDLIQRMSRENPLWGASRIHGELLMLDFKVAQSTVSKYMVRRRNPPSQTWKTFLRNHVAERAPRYSHCLRELASASR
jgi:hypothetical protein